MKILYASFAGQGSQLEMLDSFYIDGARCNQSLVKGFVLDGHGENAAAAVAYAHRTLRVTLIARPFIDETKIKSSFRTIHEGIAKKAGELSGTTATAFILNQDVLSIAYVGDSEVRMREPNSEKFDQLTEPHTFGNMNEQYRLSKMGVYPDLNRRLNRNEWAMYGTRSLGDRYFQNVGKLFSPQVVKKRIKIGTVVIVATNGLWNIFDGKCQAELSVEETVALLGEHCKKNANDNYVVIIMKLEQG